MKYNPRRPRLYTLNGVSLTIREWSEKTGIPYTTLQSRLRGKRTIDTWSIQHALTQKAEHGVSREGDWRRESYGINPLFTAWIRAPRVVENNLT